MVAVNNVLFSRADFEIATRYLHAWTNPMIGLANTLGNNVIDLSGNSATKANFENYIRSRDPYFFIGCGHGQVDRLGGQNNEIILDDQNASLMRGRIVYLYSCNTGAFLGKKLVDEGAVGYIGFQTEFKFYISDPPMPNPTSDTLAKPFFESGNAIIEAILKGKTIQDAYMAAINSFDKWISYWSQQDRPETPFMLSALYWNKDNLVSYGALESKFTKTPVKLTSPLVALPLLGLAALGFTYVTSKK